MLTRSMSTLRRSVAVGGAVLVLGGLLAGCSDAGADPFDLEVGDCLSEPSRQGVVADGDANLVACSQPHVGEVYDAIALKDGPYPGAEALVRESAKCEATFENFVGKPYGESDLKLTYFHPTQESWERGDRQILCAVEVPTGTVTNTLKGSAR